MHFAPYFIVFCNQDKQAGEFLFPGHFAFDDNPLCDSTVNAAAHYNCMILAINFTTYCSYNDCIFQDVVFNKFR